MRPEHRNAFDDLCALQMNASICGFESVCVCVCVYQYAARDVMRDGGDEVVRSVLPSECALAVLDKLDRRTQCVVAVVVGVVWKFWRLNKKHLQMLHVRCRRRRNAPAPPTQHSRSPE